MTEPAKRFSRQWTTNTGTSTTDIAPKQIKENTATSSKRYKQNVPIKVSQLLSVDCRRTALYEFMSNCCGKAQLTIDDCLDQNIKWDADTPLTYDKLTGEFRCAITDAWRTLKIFCTTNKVFPIPKEIEIINDQEHKYYYEFFNLVVAFIVVNRIWKTNQTVSAKKDGAKLTSMITAKRCLELVIRRNG